ncbi:60S ribosomal subunit assembly/export protein [Knufia peltigerae]|uniref:60S ribosomal subunit assembly/export protein n=1 Tax=Knufia peltigerae TaxID=1002370 RepID=A0AA38XXU8_9EURO|nr:60S ribosomal subunit assembly/export protein [Knufia peltigerae]
MAPKPPTSSNNHKGPKARKSATAGSTTGKSSSKVGGRRPPTKQVKSKPGSHADGGAANAKTSKKRERTYTDKELGLPALNMITPVGVQKPRGKKKGKIFVDDKESMMTILAMVNAEKEGQIESKMIKARQMEEIREARRKEMEKKKEQKQQALEEVKKGLKKGKKARDSKIDASEEYGRTSEGKEKKKKRVSFA